MNDEINYYELLGISTDATPEEIKQSYKKMMKKWHPDINKNTNASMMSVKLNDAKTILLDENKRREYDYYLNNKTSKTYENIRNYATKNKSKKEPEKEQSYNYSEEKTYTKWEYFYDYMKFYKVPTWYKILVSIGVLLETLICGILQILNLVLAYAFFIIYYIVSYLSNFFIGLLVLLIVLGLTTKSLTTFKEWFIIIVTFILLLIILVLPELIIKFLTEKMPIYLSSLNIFLFKKCIGYKN